MTLPTRRLEDFLPLVMPYARGCPYPLAVQFLRLAAIEWCERTRAWRHVTSVEITGNDEAIVAPGYATVHEIETATWNGGSELTPVQFSSVDPERLAEAPDLSPPRYVTQSSPNTLTVLPRSIGTLDVSLFLKPRSGTEYGGDPANPLQDQLALVPEHLFVQSAEHIANGALSRILAVPDESFTDGQRALFYGAKFDEAADAKFAGHMKGQHKARARTRPQWF